jgi:ATP-binding cassette subfamily F protein 3
MIRLERVARRYGARVVFEELSWLVPRAARIGLVGPNGAGKTTLLHLLSGQEAPDAGEVHRPSSFCAGYLPQEVEAVADGTVLEVALSGYPDVARIETELERLAEDLASTAAEDPRLAERTSRYGALRERYEALGGDRLEVRARAILDGLGIEAESLERPLRLLSGGWRMRVVLARLLLGEPDLLLLDEPTNHLDLAALEWLEGFLGDYAGAFVVVSHDRYLLNRVAGSIVELDRGRLTTYTGNYETYLSTRAAELEAREKVAREQAREIERVERFIERFRYKASKARQVQSRIRALEKIERVRVEAPRATIRFGFLPAPRTGDVVARVERVGKRFGERVVLDQAQLELRRGDRLALVGPNGCGKSTLLKLLAGRLDPDHGRVELGHHVVPQLYGQHQLEELDAQRSVLEELEALVPPGERARLRTLLGGFLFHGDDVNKRVGVLSGGEKARVALARMLVRPANLLLLDEPTNHLDLEGREVLEEALNEYDGTLVVVSHDRYLINRIATKVAGFDRGRIDVVPGDYDEYSASCVRSADREQETGAPASRLSDRAARAEERRREAEERNRRYRERRSVEQRLGPLEARIGELERRLAELRALQAAPGLYEDSARAAEIGRDAALAERDLARLYEEWEAAAGDAGEV